MSSRRITVVLVLVLLLILGLAAVPGGAAGATGPRYYISLGDSVAAGWQPDPLTGAASITNQGYADQLYRRLRDAVPGLQHQKMGCPGETTYTMINGGCPAAAFLGYGSTPATGQLGQALAFLAAHPGETAFITINIGVNDVLSSCPLTMPPDDLPACVGTALGQMGANLGQIVEALRTATAGQVPIVGMNYYNPFLAVWLEGIAPDGAAGPALAEATTNLASALNGVLAMVYGNPALQVPVADVFTAFRTTRWQMVGGQPFNVFRVCQYTWMCYGDPPFMDIHPNRRGHGVIASTFQEVLHSQYGIG
jgi:lysophospholipase L1-like esterase